MSKVRIASIFVMLTVMIVGVRAGTRVASAQQEGAGEVGEPEVAAQALTDLRSGEYTPWPNTSAAVDASIEVPYRRGRG